VEVGDASAPALQKRMIRLAREQNKLTITATQMMESMISTRRTAPKVSDVCERRARRHRCRDAFAESEAASTRWRRSLP